MLRTIRLTTCDREANEMKLEQYMKMFQTPFCSVINTDKICCVHVQQIYSLFLVSSSEGFQLISVKCFNLILIHIH